MMNHNGVFDRYLSLMCIHSEHLGQKWRWKIAGCLSLHVV